MYQDITSSIYDTLQPFFNDITKKVVQFQFIAFYKVEGKCNLKIQRNKNGLQRPIVYKKMLKLPVGVKEVFCG